MQFALNSETSGSFGSKNFLPTPDSRQNLIEDTPLRSLLKTLPRDQPQPCKVLSRSKRKKPGNEVVPGNATSSVNFK